MNMVQVNLQSGASLLTCWIEQRKSIRVGNVITLKNSPDPAKLWKILTVGQPKDATLIHKDWKVGGIGSK